MKRRFSHGRRLCPQELSPLSAGLFLTAGGLFALSFAFYFLSLFPL